MSIKNNIKRAVATLAIVGAITAGVFGASAVINGGADTASANGYQDWNGLMFFGQNSEGKQVGIGDATHYKVHEPNDDYARIQIHIASPKGSTLYNDPPAEPERADYDSDADYQEAVWEYQKANNACFHGLIENRVKHGLFTVDDDSSRPLVLNVFKDTMPKGCIGAVAAMAFDEDDNPVALFNPELTAAGTGPDGKHWTVAMPDGMIKEDADGNPVFHKSLTKTVTQTVRVRASDMSPAEAAQESTQYVDHVLDDDLGDFEARATQWFNAIPDACGGAADSSDVPAASAAQITAYVAKLGFTEEQAKQAHPGAFASFCEARFDVEREVEIQVENPQHPVINSQDYELDSQIIVINNNG